VVLVVRRAAFHSVAADDYFDLGEVGPAVASEAAGLGRILAAEMEVLAHSALADSHLETFHLVDVEGNDLGLGVEGVL